jgi:hypothetical protein
MLDVLFAVVQLILSSLRDQKDVTLTPVYVLLVYDLVMIGWPVAVLIGDCVQRNVLLSSSMGAIRAAQDQLYLSIQISAQSFDMVSIKFLEFLEIRISRQQFKDRLFGYIVDMRFQSQMLVFVVGVVFTLAVELVPGALEGGAEAAEAEPEW